MVQLCLDHPDGLNTTTTSLKQLPLWERWAELHSKAREGGEDCWIAVGVGG